MISHWKNLWESGWFWFLSICFRFRTQGIVREPLILRHPQIASQFWAQDFSHPSIFCLKQIWISATTNRPETLILTGILNKRLVGCPWQGLATQFYEDYTKQLTPKNHMTLTRKFAFQIFELHPSLRAIYISFAMVLFQHSTCSFLKQVLQRSPFRSTDLDREKLGGGFNFFIFTSTWAGEDSHFD